MSEDQTTVVGLVGLADACELLSVLAKFPDSELAAALADGTLAADASACMGDALAGVPERAARAVGADASSLAEGFAAFRGLDPDKLRSQLRTGYSLVHHRQFDGVEVFPCESAFCHRRDGREGEPTLFRSPITLDVEMRMRQAGVLPRTSRTEPCDSLWDELSFLAYLWGKAASALWEQKPQDAASWDGRAQSFAAEHVLGWAGDYLTRSAEVTARLADCGDVQPVCAAFCDAVRSYGCGLLAVIAAIQEEPLA